MTLKQIVITNDDRCAVCIRIQHLDGRALVITSKERSVFRETL